jgi:hypothetical protein
MPRRAERPDIEVGAAVKAKKLRFKRVPETDVRWTEGARSTSERRNLPEEVEPGVTYRDVEVRWHAQARVAAREADDEVRKTRGRNDS